MLSGVGTMFAGVVASIWAMEAGWISSPLSALGAIVGAGVTAVVAAKAAVSRLKGGMLEITRVARDRVRLRAGPSFARVLGDEDPDALAPSRQ